VTGTVPPPEASDLGWRAQKKRITRQALHTAARRRVLESGLSAVTVEEICNEVGVSPRTFFNYFPSKAAAALGLPDLRIDDERRDRFLAHRQGNLVEDLCELVADVVTGGGERLSDREAKQELLMARPELRPELFHWLDEVRRRFIDLAEERSGPEHARPAVALVMAAFSDALERRQAAGDQLGRRLWACVLTMCAVAAVHREADTAPDAQPVPA
jgi:AcrR family transcriptional regulator